MSLHLALVAGLLAPGIATAQTVTIRGAPDTYPTLTKALEKAVDGDILDLDGTFDESVTIAIDVSLIATTNGATLRSDEPLLTLDTGVALTIDGVDLVADAPVRLIVARAGGNEISIRGSTLTAGGPIGGLSLGGMVSVDKPLRMRIAQSTFVGTGQSLAFRGGAISVTSGGPLELDDVTFDGVEAAQGGAIYAYVNGVDCEDCRFVETTAQNIGGAIYSVGSEIDVRGSLFCANESNIGGAVYGDERVELRNNLFVENRADNGPVLYMNGGDALLRNNHIVGSDVDSTGNVGAVYLANAVVNLEVRNNLFFAGTGRALWVGTNGPSDVTYNTFGSNDTDSDAVLDSTNLLGVVPQLTRWSDDGNCGNDALWPTPITSPLIDAGDPSLFDGDGTRSDIGAYGGNDSYDPTLQQDGDGDGVPFFADCDDADASAGGVVEYYPDCDGDGEAADGAEGVPGCAAPPEQPPICGAFVTARWALGLGDCDDTNPLVSSTADETCDALDRNCDGDAYADAVDAFTYYLDLDLDGYGTLSFQDCAVGEPGWASVDGDCDDDDSAVHPDAIDVCGDAIDQDCDGADGRGEEQVSWWADEDGDGFGDPNRAPVVVCTDEPVDGRTTNADDCNDQNAAIYPGAVEVCNDVDDDCTGAADDGDADTVWYADHDGDGWGDAGNTVTGVCAPDAGWVGRPGDCNDGRDDIVECPGCGCASGSPLPAALLPLLALGFGLRRRTGATP